MVAKEKWGALAWVGVKEKKGEGMEKCARLPL
jgi:hypothetical protein